MRSTGVNVRGSSTVYKLSETGSSPKASRLDDRSQVDGRRFRRANTPSHRPALAKGRRAEATACLMVALCLRFPFLRSYSSSQQKSLPRGACWLWEKETHGGQSWIKPVPAERSELSQAAHLPHTTSLLTVRQHGRNVTRIYGNAKSRFFSTEIF